MSVLPLADFVPETPSPRLPSPCPPPPVLWGLSGGGGQPAVTQGLHPPQETMREKIFTPLTVESAVDAR